VNPDARDLGDSDLNREGKALEKREFHVDIEPLCLRVGKVVGDGEKDLAHRPQMLEALLHLESTRLLDQSSFRKNLALLVLAEGDVLAIDPGK
jgi:hypothetical protein